MKLNKDNVMFSSMLCDIKVETMKLNPEEHDKCKGQWPGGRICPVKPDQKQGTTMANFTL